MKLNKQGQQILLALLFILANIPVLVMNTYGIKEYVSVSLSYKLTVYMKYLELTDVLMGLFLIAFLLFSLWTLFSKKRRENSWALIIQMIGFLFFITYLLYNSSLVDSRRRDITGVDLLIMSIPFIIGVVNGITLLSLFTTKKHRLPTSTATKL